MAKKDEEKKKPSEREKRYQKKLNQEKKKLNNIISFPTKALFLISLITGLITFTFTYFGSSSEIISSILTSFFAFSLSFIGLGVGMILYFFFKSEQIKKEYAEKILKEKLEQDYEDNARFKKEMAELESIEKELFDKRSNKASTTSDKSSSRKPSMSDEEAYLEEVLNSGFNK